MKIIFYSPRGSSKLLLREGSCTEKLTTSFYRAGYFIFLSKDSPAAGYLILVTVAARPHPPPLLILV